MLFNISGLLYVANFHFRRLATCFRKLKISFLSSFFFLFLLSTETHKLETFTFPRKQVNESISFVRTKLQIKYTMPHFWQDTSSKSACARLRKYLSQAAEDAEVARVSMFVTIKLFAFSCSHNLSKPTTTTTKIKCQQQHKPK